MSSMNTQTKTPLDLDRELIATLGGPAALAKLIGYTYPGARQRVQWWTVRGIPSDVKLANPDIFLRELKVNRRKKLPTPKK